MKQILTILLLCFSSVLLAQAPQGFNYQGIARNTSGAPFPNQGIQVRLTIRGGQPSGAIEYSEERAVTTNGFGLFNLQIGAPGASNVQGSFSSINWGTGIRFLQTEVKVGAQAGFTDLGTTQLMSVPYAINSLQTRQLQFPFDTTVNSNNGAAFALKNTSIGGFPAIQGESTNGPALSGSSTNNSGVTGYSSKVGAGGVTGSNATNGGYGIHGYTALSHTNSIGVFGVSASGYGVRGETSSGRGVYGFASGNGTAVQGAALGSGYGVSGQNLEGTAVYGRTNSGIGVLAHSSQDGISISGSALGNGTVLDIAQQDSGVAINASANRGRGMYIRSSNNDAIFALSSSAAHAAGGFYNNNSGYALIADGKVRLSGSGMNAGSGKVLTSDASGNATWQAPATAPKIAFKLFGALPHGLNNYSENTWWKVYFDQEEYDFGNTVSVGSTAANSVFTAPVAGVYHFDGAVQLNAPEGAIIAGVAIVKINAAGNHSAVIERNFSETGLLNPDGIGGRPNFSASGDVQLAQGEKVYFRVFWRNGEEEDMGYTGMFPSAFTDSPKKNVFSGHLVFAL